MKKWKVRQRAIRAGYRSGLEEDNAKWLEELGVPVKYEELKITYQVKPKTYTPDFELPNGIIIETKGRFISADRTKHLLIQEQYPHLDIRFVFTNPNAKLRKGSKTSYADWCDKNGFKYAHRKIPKEWVRERKKNR